AMDPPGSRAGRRGALTGRRRCRALLLGEAFRASDHTIGVRPTHKLYGLGRRAQLVARRTNDDIQARRRFVFEPRPDLRQAAPQWRAGAAHDLRRARVRTGIYTGWIAYRVFAENNFRNLGYLDSSSAWRPTETAPPQRHRAHVDQRSTGAVFRDQDGNTHGNRYCD